METLILNQQNKLNYDEEMFQLISKTASYTADHLKIAEAAELSIVLCDNDYIKELNRTYRGFDSATDVLSFAMNEKSADEPIYGDEDGVDLLGDIVISVEKAMEQAQEYGHAFTRELGFLIVHGILHLLGYDHEAEEDEKTMRAIEETILRDLLLER